MAEPTLLVAQNAQSVIDRIVREEWGRVISALISVCRDLDTAEDALQDAVLTALKVWPLQGVPQSPRGWLLKTAQHRAIDRFRRDSTFNAKRDEYEALLSLDVGSITDEADQPIPDERLKLIFTCCHPALSIEARVALTLRTVGGISTPEIARAFLVSEQTMAQRLVRAKRKIVATNIPYVVPDSDMWPERLQSVLSVIYLIFNEGYAATSGTDLIREELCKEAIRLAEIVKSLLPEEADVQGLLALMLLHDARRPARSNAVGDLITLEMQDRNLWNHAQIERGKTLLIGALARGHIGPYQIQAAISAVHSEAPDFESTDWNEICQLYEKLYEIQPSAIVALNGAVARSFTDGPVAGLAALEALDRRETLDQYQPYHVARADMLRRAGDAEGAHDAYRTAWEMTGNEIERKFLKRRMRELYEGPSKPSRQQQ